MDAAAAVAPFVGRHVLYDRRVRALSPLAEFKLFQQREVDGVKRARAGYFANASAGLLFRGVATEHGARLAGTVQLNTTGLAAVDYASASSAFSTR